MENRQRPWLEARHVRKRPELQAVTCGWLRVQTLSLHSSARPGRANSWLPGSGRHWSGSSAQVSRVSGGTRGLAPRLLPLRADLAGGWRQVCCPYTPGRKPRKAVSRWALGRWAGPGEQIARAGSVVPSGRLPGPVMASSQRQTRPGNPGWEVRTDHWGVTPVKSSDRQGVISPLAQPSLPGCSSPVHLTAFLPALWTWHMQGADLPCVSGSGTLGVPMPVTGREGPASTPGG